MRFLLLLLLCLANECIASECQIISKDDPQFTIQKCDQLTVLTLKGTPLERAQANGRATKKFLSFDVVHYFSDKILNVLAQENGLSRALWKFTLNQVTRIFYWGAPSDIKAEINVMAQEMNLSPIELERAFLLPDMGSLAFSFSSRATDSLKENSSSGCTSVVRKFDPTSLVYGRNLDFSGVGTYDKNPLITVHLPPENSGELKHIGFGAHGMLYAGITGINEAGIGFAVHQNYTRDRGLFGVPMPFVGELVLRKAKTLTEAVEIIRRNRTNTLWTFVLTDFTHAEALTVEQSRDHFSVRTMNGIALAQTNHMHNVELQKSTEVIPLGVKVNSEFRLNYGMDQLEHFSSLENAPFELLRILSFQINKEGELSAFGDVLKAHTIQTVLILGKEGKVQDIAISEDPAPTASGRLLRFAFTDLLKTMEQPLQFQVLDNRPTSEIREQQRQTSLAFAAYFDHKDYAKAMLHIKNQKTPNAAFFRATLLYAQDQLKDSLDEIDRVLQSPQGKNLPSHIYQSGLRLKMLSQIRLAPLNSFEAQKTAFQILNSHPLDPQLRVLAKKVSAGEKITQKELHLAFDFFSGEIVNP